MNTVESPEMDKWLAGTEPEMCRKCSKRAGNVLRCTWSYSLFILCHSPLNSLWRIQNLKTSHAFVSSWDIDSIFIAFILIVHIVLHTMSTRSIITRHKSKGWKHAILFIPNSAFPSGWNVFRRLRVNLRKGAMCLSASLTRFYVRVRTRVVRNKPRRSLRKNCLNYGRTEMRGSHGTMSEQYGRESLSFARISATCARSRMPCVQFTSPR